MNSKPEARWRQGSLYGEEAKKKMLADNIKTLAAACGVVALVWSTVVWLDIRPVLSRELKPLWSAIGGVQRGVQLINYQIYSERIEHGGTLSTQERAEYCTIGEILNVPTSGCRT